MKNFKKLMALVIAGVMVVGSMSFSAFAENTMNPDFDSSISITGLTKDDVVDFYQVIEWVGITDPATAGAVGGWKVKAPFDTVIDVDELKAILVDDPTTPDVKDDAIGITSAMAGELARAITGNPAFSKTVTSTPGSAEITGLTEGQQGMYIAIITPADVDTVYNPVIVSSDYFTNDSNTHGVPESSYADHAAAKKSTLTLTKESEGDATVDTDHPNNDADGDTTDVGDVVKFTVNTQIPRYGKVYTNPTFNVHDELTDLKLDQNSIEVYADGVKLTKGTEYTIPTISDTEYLVKFDSTWLKNNSKIMPIKITYSAEVTSAAAKNVNEEDNQVEIIYSHNPKDTTGQDFKSKKDTTQHYTFTLDASGLGFTSEHGGKKTSELLKVGLDGEGKPITETRTSSEITEEKYVESPLAGAVFGLYKVKTDADAGNDKYYKNDIFQGTVTTTADGRMTIQGLDAGTYYLKELTAPAGFIKDPHTYQIDITAHLKPVSITEYYKASADGNDVVWSASKVDNTYREFTYDTEVLEWYKVTVDGNETEHKFVNPGTSTSVTWIEESAKEAPTSIINTKGVELPSTGGVGTTMFYIVGAILVLGAGILLVSKRRMAAN